MMIEVRDKALEFACPSTILHVPQMCDPHIYYMSSIVPS